MSATGSFTLKSWEQTTQVSREGLSEYIQVHPLIQSFKKLSMGQAKYSGNVKLPKETQHITD